MDYGRRHSGAPLSDYKQFSDEITDQYITSLGILYQFEFKQPYYHEDYQAMIYLFNAPYQSPYLENQGNLSGILPAYDPFKFSHFKWGSAFPTVPYPDCETFWENLFPGHPVERGPFIPAGIDFEKLRLYEEECPVMYKLYFCCGEHLRISGQFENLCAGSTYQFNVVNPPHGCEYDFYADKGWITFGGLYTAPLTVPARGKDTIWISPFTKSDAGAMCKKWDVSIIYCEPCTASILYTTLQMATDASQTLEVSGWEPGRVYTWAITAGGGSLSTATGSTTVYTAPSTNTNCTNNPTVTLSCDSVEVNSITIAVNDYGTALAGRYFTHSVSVIDPSIHYEDGPCNWSCGEYCRYYWPVTGHRFDVSCSGTVTDVGSSGRNELSYASCDAAQAQSYSGLWYDLAHDVLPGQPETWNIWIDVRTPTQKANGCCPAQLI